MIRVESWYAFIVTDIKQLEDRFFTDSVSRMFEMQRILILMLKVCTTTNDRNASNSLTIDKLSMDVRKLCCENENN